MGTSPEHPQIRRSVLPLAHPQEQYREECLHALLKVEEAETKQRRTVLEDEDWFWERQVLWESHGEICRCGECWVRAI